MAGIYQADIYCDDCVEDIKRRICDDMWERRDSIDCLPDGTPMAVCEDIIDLDSELRGMSESDYDSDAYPKWCHDDEESDCPQHCGSGAECIDYSECSDGERYGYFFGNSLTADGDDYVREAVREDLFDGRNDSPAVELWMACYDYIDYGPEARCATCGDFAELNDDDECEDCSDD